MKLIIKEYLASLKERGELDDVLPDLLSQMGLNVYSRPTRGTRQDGVDVAAVGSIDGEPEKVYLFSIKPGDLNRKDWSSDSPQSLRPSLNEILDSYIPSRLPVEHRDKSIVICIAIGGDVHETARSLVTGYISTNTKNNVSFEEWNGDKLADLIQSSFLREDLLPATSRSLFRKSLALLDEPDVSYRNFAALVRSLSAVESLSDAQKITAIRQMSICLWILYSWAREAKNLESAYRSGELSVLHAWNILKPYAGRGTHAALAVETAFLSIFSVYQQISTQYLKQNVLPYADKSHAVSVAVRGSTGLDINLKLFEILGRLGMDGIWAYWGILRFPNEDDHLKQERLKEVRMYSDSVRALIENNPALYLPATDDQAIDIFIAMSFLMTDGRNYDFAKDWMAEMFRRASFTVRANGKYPCTLHSYAELLEHPKKADKDYKTSVTQGSILYPCISLWAALLGDDVTFQQVAQLKKDELQHCTFQFWYPDENSEDALYTNSMSHGATLAHLAVDRTKAEFLKQVFGECEHSPHFHELSAVKFAWWPLVLAACRHYRLPVPLHVLLDLYKAVNTVSDGENVAPTAPTITEK